MDCMKHVIIAPFDDDMGPLFAGVREIPTEKIHLIAPERLFEKAEEARKQLERFKIPTEVHTVKDESSLEEVFGLVLHLRAREKDKLLAVNLSAPGMMGCAALSAAFVNGLKAFEILDDKLVLFPILKFSYYDMLSEKKVEVLKRLQGEKEFESLESLSRAVRLGPSLINYHVYGNEKNPGLKELGLIDVEREKGKVRVSLTALGRLLMQQKGVTKAQNKV